MKSYWIKERHNPQLGVNYYPCGKLSKAEAKKKENTLYGTNYMHEYKTFEEYDNALREFNKEEVE